MIMDLFVIGSVYLIWKLLVHLKEVTFILIKVKSCSAMLHKLLVCILTYLKSVWGYKFLILDTYQLDTLYLCEQDVRVHGYFLKPKRWMMVVRQSSDPLEYYRMERQVSMLMQNIMNDTSLGMKMYRVTSKNCLIQYCSTGNGYGEEKFVSLPD